ncbi:hypothetical protein [Streptomyces sp. NPDC089919]|uniref:hypothetical protein n=1 Tax=Streptomyces sp. NPDC089919 TaxID=3155188 RepID=UPI003449ACB1
MPIWGVVSIMVQLRGYAAVAVACAALALGTVGIANAAGTATSAPAANASTGRHAVTRTAPSAPAGVRSFGPTATSPYTSPASTAGHVAPGQTYTCEYLSLCELVWDPTTGNWELFKQDPCNRYSVSYWNDGGYFVNNQSSGTVSRFYGSSGNTLWTDTSPTEQTYADWTPVHSLRNC